jgi:hypothetical protein
MQPFWRGVVRTIDVQMHHIDGRLACVCVMREDVLRHINHLTVLLHGDAAYGFISFHFIQSARAH